MEKFEFQERFVAQLKATVASNINLADELADLLNVSTDSIYRRLRCASSFSLDETAIISKKFGITLDGMINLDTLQVSFSFNPLFGQNANFFNYLKWFAEYLTELSVIPGARIIYAADDVPVIRHFRYPTLSAFKSYYWSKVVLNLDQFETIKFRPGIIPSQLLELNETTYQAYSKINTIEIWTEETLASTLKQVDFFWESGLFENNEDALAVVSDIQKMMHDLSLECENSLKENDERKGKFLLYLSDVMIGNNCVLIESAESKLQERVFLGHNTFNNISTYNAAFREETKSWLDNLIKKSMLLSGSGEKQRAIFFRKMFNRIDQLEQKVRGSVSSS